MTIYLTDDAFSVKAKRFHKMFTSISTLFFLPRIPNKSHFHAPILLVLTIFASLSVAVEKSIKCMRMLKSRFRVFMHNFDDE